MSFSLRKSDEPKMRGQVCAIIFCFFLASPCYAGPCAQDIHEVQIKIDQKLNAIAAAGPTQKQSKAAQMHRQPTPRSMAKSEVKGHELSPTEIEKVKNAMERARAADAAGNKGVCDQALAQARKYIGP
jgi:hypothetical protein